MEVFISYPSVSCWSTRRCQYNTFVIIQRSVCEIADADGLPPCLVCLFIMFKKGSDDGIVKVSRD